MARKVCRIAVVGYLGKTWEWTHEELLALDALLI
jgi:hypothetical protein